MPDAEPEGYRHRGTRAIQRMVEFAPATGGLALWAHHRDLRADEWPEAHGPLVWTDGHAIHYAAGFSALPLAEQTGRVAHAVLHVALRHPQRFLALRARLGDVDLQLFNVCADAIVNSALGHLGWLSLPPDAVDLQHLLVRTMGIEVAPESALLEWDVERLYRAIDDRAAARSGRQRSTRQTGGGNGAAQQGTQSSRRASGSGNGATAHAAEPGTRMRAPAAGVRAAIARSLAAPQHADLRPDETAQGAPEAQAEQAREWSERILRAHAGDGVFSMLRALIADVPRSRTPWEQTLRTRLTRALATRPSVSWSRPSRSYIANQGRGGPDRRLPWEPGISASKAVPRLAVVVDVSGSIDDGLMERFAREVEAITRRTESGMVLVIGDDRVRRVEHCQPGRSSLREIAFDGGGGTDLTPLLEEADRHRPDIAVVLTDLEGPARFRPRWPVIWAVPEASAGAAEPFGRKVVLD
jgi:predicted metal-dependent peptidase